MFCLGVQASADLELSSNAVFVARISLTRIKRFDLRNTTLLASGLHMTGASRGGGPHHHSFWWRISAHNRAHQRLKLEVLLAQEVQPAFLGSV